MLLAAATSSSKGGGISSLLPLIIIGAGVVLLLQRSRRNRARVMAQAEQPIDIGREVLLRAGIRGVVAGMAGDDLYLVEVAPGVRLRVVRRAIGEVLPVPSSEEADLDAPGGAARWGPDAGFPGAGGTEPPPKEPGSSGGGGSGPHPDDGGPDGPPRG